VRLESIIPNGLPWMVLIHSDGLIKDELVEVFDQKKILFTVVNPEQHEGILCERFHSYLNKVQKIEGCKSVDHQEWMKNCLLATYAWNAGPIDETNIARSLAANLFDASVTLLSELWSMSRLWFLCGIDRKSF
jgi:hypothetical protein